jgi:ornithine carbamoyltransferase
VQSMFQAPTPSPGVHSPAADHWEAGTMPAMAIVAVNQPATDAPYAVSLGGPFAAKAASVTISTRLQARSVLVDTDLTRDEIAEVLQTAARLKGLQRAGQPHPYLCGMTLGLLFRYPSTRTRVAFEAGIAQLGGQAVFLGVGDLQMKRGETITDTARVLSRYVDGIVARVASHADLEEIDGAASVPVLNGLTDRVHPLQAFSDLLTLQERFGALEGLKLAFLGDGNNVCHSLLLSGAAMGVSVTVAAPAGYQPDPALVAQAGWLAAASGAGNRVAVIADPEEAVAGADAVYTDVHVSMGQRNGPARAVALTRYKVTQRMMAEAAPHAVFMHCMPMHRDQEVDTVVADGPQSIIFEQAENRLHVHKALLLQVLARNA